MFNFYRVAMQNIVDEHRKTFDPNDPRDFIDFFFIEQEKQKDNPDTTFTGF